MRLLISPAKKMKVDTDTLGFSALPVFLERTAGLMRALQGLTLREAQALWRCSERLAGQNYERLRTMDLERSLTPAILAYEGLQYQHMAPVVFTEDALCYAQEHLRILSGFYGVLRPLDGIVPYRLEMQAALSVDGKKDLYEFWGGTLYEALQEGNADGIIVNLASKEYARAVEPYRKPGDLFLTVVFAERCDGKLRQKGTCAKMARGEMVRFLAETRASSPEAMKDFSALDYRYQESCSDGDTWVFVREETGK